jgi:hypothetical protein
MSITKVEVRTPLGALLTLTLEDPTNGYLIEDIVGLDPVKATIVSSTFANFPGAKYQASRREIRNILLKLKLEPNFVTQTVRQLRSNLYEFFESDTEVSLRFFMVDGLTVDIAGRVESCEAPLFTQEPKAVISIICFNPDFVDLTPVAVSGNTVATLTEFTIDYPGDISTGFVFVLNLNRTLSDFTIYHRPADNVLRTFDFSSSLLSGDVLTINTIDGSKAVTLNRSGTLTSLLYGKSPQSNWFKLMRGNNRLRVYAVGAAIPFTITYTPRYGGL